MSRHLATAILSIASGQTRSSTLGDFWGANPGKVALDHADMINIQSPAALTGVVRLQASQISPAASSDFATCERDGNDLVIPAAKSVLIPIGLAGRDICLLSDSAEGAKRDFLVTLQENI